MAKDDFTCGSLDIAIIGMSGRFSGAESVPEWWDKLLAGDEGIFDGDLIGVHRTRDARSGQIVVARIDDAITVKLLKIGKDRIRLLPRNPDYAPIEVAPDQDFAIEGLYCGLVRPNR